GRLERVAVHAVDAEYVVQVRAGGQAGAADVADHRALLEPRAGLVLAEARHVRIEGGVALAVVEHHGAAVAALPAHERHARVAGGHDRGAVSGAVVHALVGAGAAQDRVLARAAEAGGDPRIRNRHADEGLFQRTAVGVVVTHGAVALEAEAGVGLAAGGEARGLDRAAADALALAPGLVVDDAEAVAFLGAGEVDVVLEDLVGHRHDRRRAEAGAAGRRIQRRFDFAGGGQGAGLD